MPKKFTKEDLRVIVSANKPEEMKEVPYSDLTIELSDNIYHEKLTLAQYACAVRHWSFLRKIAQLYKADIKLDTDDKAKFGSALFVAVQENNIHTARVLLEAGVVKRWIDKTNGDTPLHVAVKNRNKEMIDLLLSYGFDIRATNKTPIELASYKNEWECVETIAKHQKTDAEDKARYGYALLAAVCENRIETAKLLLEAGAPINTASLYSADTALHKAVRRNNVSMVEMLLSFDCDLTIENIEKQTPMQLAAALKHWDVIDAIAKKQKTDINDRAKYSDVLYDAVNINRVNTVKLLLEAGANLVKQQPASKPRENCGFASSFFSIFYRHESEAEKTIAALEKNLRSNR